MITDAMVIDCDGHILEPPDLWERYLEPRYRHRALRIRVGASDDPHPDHPGGYLEELRAMVAPMPAAARRGILGENVARACKLG